VVSNVNQLIDRIEATWRSSDNSVDRVRILKKMVENPTKLVAYNSWHPRRKISNKEIEAIDKLSDRASELAVLNNVNDVVCSIVALKGINEGSKFEELKELFANKEKLLQIMNSTKQIDLKSLRNEDENVES